MNCAIVWSNRCGMTPLSLLDSDRFSDGVLLAPSLCIMNSIIRIFHYSRDLSFTFMLLPMGVIPAQSLIKSQK
jgi:hypothetical protein